MFIGLGLSVQPVSTSVLFIEQASRGTLPHVTLSTIMFIIGILITGYRLKPLAVILGLLPTVWVFCFQSYFLWQSPIAPKWPIAAYLGYAVTLLGFYIYAIRTDKPHGAK